MFIYLYTTTDDTMTLKAPELGIWGWRPLGVVFGVLFLDVSTFGKETARPKMLFQDSSADSSVTE